MLSAAIHRAYARAAGYRPVVGVAIRLRNQLDAIVRYGFADYDPRTNGEHRLVRAVAAVSPGGRFVDVGSHVGGWSEAALHAFGPGCRALLVEPSPTAAAAARRRVDAAAPGRCEVVEAAAGDAPGEAEFFEAGSDGGGTTSSRRRASAPGWSAAGSV